jgi:hypothetical protein
MLPAVAVNAGVMLSAEPAPAPSGVSTVYGLANGERAGQHASVEMLLPSISCTVLHAG